MLGLLVCFDGEDCAQSQIFAIGDAQGRSRFKNTLDDVQADNNRVCPVEAGVGDHLTNAREDGFIALACLSLTLTLLFILNVVVLQMVDNLGCEHSDAIFLCKLLSIRHYFDVKG